MLFVFGSYEKIREVHDYDFLSDSCPKCDVILKVMEKSRYFSFMYLIRFKVETLGYFFYCPKCNSEFSSNDIFELRPQNI